MTDIPEGTTDATESPIKAVLKAKPIKILPTDRLTFDKQLGVIRAYAAASGNDKQPTSNAEVAKVADLNPNSISLCNPFLVDCGLLIREGMKQRPAQAVFDYHAAWEWNKDTAGLKLNAVFANTWFAKTLLPKLGFRSLTTDEAVSFLADDARAPKEYKDQLVLLLEYLKVAGVIAIEGNNISKVNGKREFDTPPPPPAANLTPLTPAVTPPLEPPSDVQRFSIPIPNKAPATITVPKDFDADDWEMLSAMMATYIKRWKKELIKDSAENDAKKTD